MLRWAYLPECNSLPEGWVIRRFRDIANVVAGQSPPSESYNKKGDGLPFLQGNADFSLKYPKPLLWCSAPSKVAEVGDTLFSVRAPVGEMNRADRTYAIGRGLVALSATEVDPDFLYHAVQRWRWCLQRVAQGTTFDAVTAKHFAQLYVAVPASLEEQRVIAQILDSLDDAVERSHEEVQTATIIRKSLLAELLCSGVGLDGKVRGSYQAPGEFTKTALGELPNEWALSVVGSEFDIQTGFTLNESRRPRYLKRRYLRVANVQRDTLDLVDVRELEAQDAEFSSRVLEIDDLLVVEGHADSMQIGRCARVNSAAAGMTFQNHLFRLRSKGRLLPAFSCLWLNSSYAQQYWNARCATSSGLNTINQRTLKRLIIPVPPLPEQARIATVVASQRTHLESLSNTERALERLRKATMHDLLTGKVRADQIRVEA